MNNKIVFQMDVQRYLDFHCKPVARIPTRIWVYADNDKECQDAVEGRARFARPNIPRPSKAIGEYSE